MCVGGGGVEWGRVELSGEGVEGNSSSNFQSVASGN